MRFAGHDGRMVADRLIRVDYHGSKEVPTGTCQAVLKSAYIRSGGRR